jgi:peptidoglycan/LPS O-acetylase OafA/YrhL
VAILGVLARHSLIFRTPTWDFFPVRAGWAGVDLFFVISGFLISGLLFSEYRKRGSIRVRRFAIRRILKIWPPLYFLVLSTLAVRLISNHFHGIQAALRLLLHDVLFMQSYAAGTWGHCWSLAVEEHFYILLPLTLWFLLRKARPADSDPFRILPIVFVCLAIVLLAARLITAHYFAPYKYEINLFPTHLRIDSLFFGVIISYYAHFHGERFSQFAHEFSLPLTAGGIVLVAPCFLMEQSQHWMYTYGYAALYLGFGSLLIVFLHVPVESAWPPILRALKALAYVGTFSYSIYLWHLAWVQFVAGLDLGGIPYVGLFIYYGGAIAAGIVISKLIEMPTLRLRDRVFPAGVALAPVGPVSVPAAPQSRRAELPGSRPDSGPVQVAHVITNVDPV